VFRFNERHDNDGGRFAKVLGNVFEQRIDYKTLTGKVALAQRESHEQEDARRCTAAERQRGR
jgi:hypothetical protein